MSLEIAGQLYAGIVAGVVGGLILRLAQIISKKFNKQEVIWAEALICLILLVALALYLTFLFK